jgi:ethanolamine utilization microcompartment shell protein EutL
MTCKAALLSGLLLALAAGAAHAASPLPDGQSQAVLANPAPHAMEAVIDGRIWRCEGTSCVALANDSADQQSVPKECHRAAIWLGKFVSYQTGPKILSDAEVSACNVNVTTKEPRSPG